MPHSMRTLKNGLNNGCANGDFSGTTRRERGGVDEFSNDLDTSAEGVYRAPPMFTPIVS